jgi:hypothetical protein
MSTTWIPVAVLLLLLGAVLVAPKIFGLYGGGEIPTPLKGGCIQKSCGSIPSDFVIPKDDRCGFMRILNDYCNNDAPERKCFCECIASDFYTLLSPKASAEEKKWAENEIESVLGR